MPRDLARAGKMLDSFPHPRRLLIQWVPHAFGLRSANVPFSLWIWGRALAHRDHVELMIHEPYLPLPQRHFRHTALALTHRFMLAVVMGGARRVWTAIPEWEQFCRPYVLGRSIPFVWLPVPSNITPSDECRSLNIVRNQYASQSQWLIGHFGTCGGEIGVTLRAVIPLLLDRRADAAVLLIGRDGDWIRNQLLTENRELRGRVYATGPLSNSEASLHIAACDVMLQPYPDGVTSRRTSLMAALSHGKAVVTSCGALTESIWKEGFVELAHAGNNSEIVHAIEKLLANKVERERLGAAAKAMYDRRFDLPHIIELLRNP